MSTALFSGRIPASVSRLASHEGDGPSVMFVSSVAVNTGQRSGASTTTDGPLADGSGSSSVGSASVNGRPSLAAMSRATPAMHSASGRLPSIARSNTTSVSMPSASTRRVPGVSASSRIMMPSPSVPSSSSRAEQIIPCDSTPFILRAPMAKSPGRTAPTGANATVAPASKFHAPHTTCVGSPPASTTTRRIRSAPLIGPTSRTLGDDHVADAGAHVRDALDHESELVRRVDERVDVIAERREVAQPRERN